MDTGDVRHLDLEYNNCYTLQTKLLFAFYKEVQRHYSVEARLVS